MKRVLVTGATGFIGRHTLPILTGAGYEVHAVSTGSRSRAELQSALWHRCNLLDDSQIEDLMSTVKPTYLLHLAWYSVPGKFWTSMENLRWVRATLELVRVFGSYGGRRVVAAGSCAEYDWSTGQCSELTTPLKPATLYGACKLSVEIVLGAYCRQFGMSYAWGRIFFLYGPWEHRERFVASVISSLLLGVPARCSHGQQIRDFSYVRDVAHAFVALLECEANGAINIASSQPVTLKSIACRIAEKLDRTDLLEMGALSAAVDDPPLLTADTTILRRETDWRMNYDLERGLDETIEWWKTNLSAREIA